MRKKISAPMVVLETERLVLRPMTDADANTVVGWRNSEHVSSMSLQTATGELSVDEHLAWFSSSRSDRVDYVLERKENQHPIGSISLTWREFGDRVKTGEMGKYIGDRSALGKGYASEATGRWLRYAFEEIGLERVVSRTRRTNEANIRINQNLGFSIHQWPEEFGPASDEWIFMRLTRPEWLRSRMTVGSPE